MLYYLRSTPIRLILAPLLVTLVLGVWVPHASAVDWVLTDLQGEQHNLSDYRGRWVVVNFWATWCPPCIEEIPELVQFHDNNQPKAVVIGVNFEEVDDQRLKAFVDENFMIYPVYRVTPRFDTPVGSVSGLPTTYLVNPGGEVVARQVGEVTEAMLLQFIDEWEAKNGRTAAAKR